VCGRVLPPRLLDQRSETEGCRYKSWNHAFFSERIGRMIPLLISKKHPISAIIHCCSCSSQRIRLRVRICHMGHITTRFSQGKTFDITELKCYWVVPGHARRSGSRQNVSKLFFPHFSGSVISWTMMLFCFTALILMSLVPALAFLLCAYLRVAVFRLELTLLNTWRIVMNCEQKPEG
jgi:hypothetical protein